MPSTPPPPALDIALFLDIDGTLVDFTDTPSSTRADPELKHLLTLSAAKLQGALALVSGREIKTMDALFAPLKFPAAGLHGVERRDANGGLHGADFHDPRLDGVRAALSALPAAYPGVLIEDKGRNIAVHYRLAPQHAQAVQRAVADIAAPLADCFQLQHGLLMLELKPRGFDKGTAIAAFLEEAPFRQRKPVFIGDDLTDRDGFRVVDAAGGFSVAVGARVQGRYRLEDVEAVRTWLRRLTVL